MITDLKTLSDKELLNEIVEAWPPVLAILQDYDANFPYAEMEGDDEKGTRLNMAVRELKRRNP